MKSLFFLVLTIFALNAHAAVQPCDFKLRGQASRIAEQISNDIGLDSYVIGFQDTLATMLGRGLNVFASWKVVKLKLDSNNHYVEKKRFRQAGAQSEFANGISFGQAESFVLEQNDQLLFLNSSIYNGHVEAVEIIWVEQAKSKAPVRHYLTVSRDLFSEAVYASGSGARSVEALVRFMEYTRHHNAKDISALIQKWLELEN